MNYREQCFEIDFSAPSIQDILIAYTQYLSKYITAAQVTHRIALLREQSKNLPLYDGYLLVFNSLSCFFDDTVHKKRMQAVEDMFRAAEFGLRQQNLNNDKAMFRDYIDRYFNSKYIGELSQYTDDGKINDAVVLARFLTIIGDNTKGSRIENMEHMRGACTRLLQENPDNYVLLILRSLTYFSLAADNQDDVGYGFQDMVSGFQLFIDDNKMGLSMSLYNNVLGTYLSEVEQDIKPSTYNRISDLVNSIYIKTVLHMQDKFLKN
jgi:ATP-dependent DNA helicase RecQ